MPEEMEVSDILDLSVSVIVLLALIAVFSDPLFGAIQEATRTNARFVALELAGMVNVLQTAQDGVTLSYKLPKADCTIEFEKSFVRVSFPGGKFTEYTAELVQFPFASRVTPVTYGCDRQQEATLILESINKQNQNEIKISK